MTDTWHGLTETGELRLVRLQEIADRLEAIASERDDLYAERSRLFSDARLDDVQTPTQTLADYARVSDAAVSQQLRSEEERLGLDSGTLGRRRRPPAA